eukprot:gene9731-33611_t
MTQVVSKIQVPTRRDGYGGTSTYKCEFSSSITSRCNRSSSIAMQRYAGWEVLKFGGLTQLQLHNFSSHDDLDVWSIAKAEHGDEPLYSATALVPPHRLNDVLHTFGNRHSSHTVEVLDSDLDATLFQEKEAIEKKRQSNWTAKDDSFFSTFRPYEDHVALMRQLSDEHPDVITILPFIGRTVEGREIPAVVLRSPSRSKTGKRADVALYLQSTVHAREWLATTSLAWTMKRLAEGYGVEPGVTYLLDNCDVYIVPIVNVDGYIFTWEDTRLWRKNRRDNGDGSFGVDINRNFGPASTWCSSGSSTNPNSDTYCGPRAFSEPETEAAAQFVVAHPEILGSIDFHTYGPLVLWPWQYTYDRVPEPSFTELSVLGGLIELSINALALPDYRYISQQGSDLYPHSGGIIDYAFKEHGIYAFTFEGRGFVTPDSDIIPAGQEQWDGVLALGTYVINNKK